MNSKQLIQEIRELKWAHFNPYLIAYLSWVTAVEFAESLRCALIAYPLSKELQLMAAGELKTDNLDFLSYHQRTGDHSEFLDHFIYAESKLLQCRFDDDVKKASLDYWGVVRGLTNEQRAMTVFSREQELPGIFKEILDSHVWVHKDSWRNKFGFYDYYLRRHIELDSAEGGHGDLTKSFPLDEATLIKFYQARLKLYQLLADKPWFS